MKGIIILALALLAGCTSYTPLKQLEDEAMLSGDWSLVEKRERTIARSQMRLGTQCPGDKIRFCQSTGGGNYCECVESRVIRSLFDDDR